MLDQLIRFTHALRDAGVPVSVAENIDTLRALPLVDVADRTAFKAALATTMIKSESHRPAFESLFNVFFDGAGPPELNLLQDAQLPPVEPEEFIAGLASGIAGGTADIDEAARDAVSYFGRIENSPSDSLYFEYPVFKTLDMDVLLQRLMQEITDDTELEPFEAQVLRDRFNEEVQRFRAAVRAEVQQRVARRKGPEAVTKHSIRPLPQDIDLMTASRAEMDEMRRMIRPLARKLASRTAMRRRRSSRGGVDLRKTLRHSLSTGGVPMDVVLRHKVPHKPELFVLCDISSSVARFARFSLMLVHALSTQFSKVRSFVFIDTIDEVTHLFDHEDLFVAVDRVNEEAEVVWIDGHSNYGASLTTFLDRYGQDVTSRSTVLVLGDARNNFRQPKAEALRAIRERAKHLYWLNPEPEPYWDSGDSAAGTYATFTDGMFEVRTLRHLETFVERVLG